MKALQQIYRGWWVHAGLFICAAIIIGCTSYTFGLFVIPVTQDLEISRATVNNGFISLLLGVAVLSPFVGKLLDRFPARLVMLSGAITFVIGLATIAHTSSPALMLLMIVGPISYGYAACGTLAVNTITVRWFRRLRGTALGIMAVSTSTGGFLFAPFTATMIQNFDWRSALLINGSIALVGIGLMTLLLVRNFPKGTEPGYEREFADSEQDAQRTPAEKKADEKQWTYAELFRNRNFWLLTLSVGLLLSSDQALVTSKIPYFVDIGIDMQSAALIVSCMTASAICGKLLVGYLADKIDLRFVFYGVAIAHLGLLLVYMSQPSFWVLLFFATLFGVAIGGVFPVWSTMLAWLFGTGNYGTVMGAMTIIMKGMSVVAVRFIGEVHDATGSYMTAFVVFAVAIVLAMILAAMLRPAGRDKTEKPLDQTTPAVRAS